MEQFNREKIMERSFRLDLMRLLGLLLIIFAHIGPPNALFQIRTFDVPMMIFVSGVAYYISSPSFFLGRSIISREFQDYYFLFGVFLLFFMEWCIFLILRYFQSI